MSSEPMKNLATKIANIQASVLSSDKSKQIFEVNNLIGKAATFYEKVRYLVDYKEEHTIRRNALERILKRKMVIEGRNVTGVSILQELASGQYIPEEVVTEELGNRLNQILIKFLRLEELSGEGGVVAKRLLSFTASEIDYTLSHYHHVTDHAIIDTFYEMMRKNISVPKAMEKDLDNALYCACHRALIRADDEGLAYALWLKYVPEWHNISNENLSDLSKELKKIIYVIDEAIKHPLQWRLVQKLKNETIYFLIVRELVQQYGQNSSKILETPGDLEIFTQSLLEKKYQKENERIRKSGIRAVIYLFFTKAIFALSLELPYEYLFLSTMNYLPIMVNLLFPPILLFIATRGVGSFNKNNTKAVLTGMREMFYDGKVAKIKIKSHSTIAAFIFTGAYLILAGTVFGTMISVLHLLHFNFVSITIFLFFLALVSYFAFRIRYNAKRWKTVQKENLLSLLASLLTVPIIRTGRWLSQSFSSINVFVIIMDFIIETPFKLLLDFSNQFITYLKEKTPEIY
jgi:hypothetical protein